MRLKEMVDRAIAWANEKPERRLTGFRVSSDVWHAVERLVPSVATLPDRRAMRRGGLVRGAGVFSYGDLELRLDDLLPRASVVPVFEDARHTIEFLRLASGA